MQSISFWLISDRNLVGFVSCYLGCLLFVLFCFVLWWTLLNKESDPFGNNDIIRNQFLLVQIQKSNDHGFLVVFSLTTLKTRSSHISIIRREISNIHIATRLYHCFVPSRLTTPIENHCPLSIHSYDEQGRAPSRTTTS